MPLDAAACHAVAVVEPAPAEQIEAMAAIELGRRHDPAARRAQRVAGDSADQPDEGTFGRVVAIGRTLAVALPMDRRADGAADEAESAANHHVGRQAPDEGE